MSKKHTFAATAGFQYPLIIMRFPDRFSASLALLYQSVASHLPTISGSNMC